MWTGPAESSFQPFQNDEELHLDYLDQGNLKSVRSEGKDVLLSSEGLTKRPFST